jgi:hypothetical protein
MLAPSAALTSPQQTPMALIGEPERAPPLLESGRKAPRSKTGDHPRNTDAMSVQMVEAQFGDLDVLMLGGEATAGVFAIGARIGREVEIHRSIISVEIPGEVQTRPTCSSSRNRRPTSSYASRRAVSAGSASSVKPAGHSKSSVRPVLRKAGARKMRTRRAVRRTGSNGSTATALPWSST